MKDVLTAEGLQSLPQECVVRKLGCLSSLLPLHTPISPSTFCHELSTHSTQGARWTILDFSASKANKPLFFKNHLVSSITLQQQKADSDYYYLTLCRVFSHKSLCPLTILKGHDHSPYPLLNRVSNRSFRR
jgi:hypothetical protein